MQLDPGNGKTHILFLLCRYHATINNRRTFYVAMNDYLKRTVKNKLAEIQEETFDVISIDEVPDYMESSEFFAVDEYNGILEQTRVKYFPSTTLINPIFMMGWTNTAVFADGSRSKGLQKFLKLYYGDYLSIQINKNLLHMIG